MDHSENIIAGVMRWGNWGANFNNTQYQQAIMHCLNNNINTFDHADIYGHYTTEAEFGNAIKNLKIKREQYKLITKCGIQLPCAAKTEIEIKSYNTSKQYIINAVNQSLINLKTDYIDTLLIHRPSPLMQAEEIAEAFTILKQTGKVFQFGVSNFNNLQIDNLLKSYPEIGTHQMELSFTKSDFLFNGLLQYNTGKNIKTQAWSPLGNMQNLSEENESKLLDIVQNYHCTIAQILYAWLGHVPQQVSVVIGTTNLNRISEAVAAKKIILNNFDWFEILKIGRGIDVD